MTRKLAVFACAFSSLLLVADDGPKQKAQLTKSQHMDFVARGTLRVENSIDELVLEGWDRPDVEITTTVSTKFAYGPRERETIASKLGQVQVIAQRHGDDMVVATSFPNKHRVLWTSLGDLYLRSHISLPRATRVAVRHHSGEVHVIDLSGDMDVRVPRGLITLSLPQEGPYEIDAKSDFGSVTSDFPGHAQRRFWLMGHQFLQNTPANAVKLHLRIGYGDIEVLKINQPAAPPPAGH
jgi:hypothetical protein